MKGAVLYMKTSNNSPADNEVAKNDTPNALISDNDLLKFFNLERENVQDFSITRRKDGIDRKSVV